jgi:dephospho-CoA kinase
MGKSTVAAYLQRLGHRVIDTDLIARQLVEDDKAIYQRIICRFGEAVIAEPGVLNRKALAGIVFSNGEARRDLEMILHPEIRAVWMHKVKEWEDGGTEISFVVIPLLFEIGVRDQFDFIVCVACGEDSQMTRLEKRGWSPVEIGQRLVAQMPVEAKISLSNFVVWTEATLKVTEDQVDAVIRRLV